MFKARKKGERISQTGREEMLKDGRENRCSTRDGERKSEREGGWDGEAESIFFHNFDSFSFLVFLFGVVV